MTKEEAINKVRQMSFPKETMDILEALAPELAESDDERIREELIEYHKRQFENNRDQEVGLFHKDALAWLEKQKENPKTADSIPSDCASDAKCEDRWHKVSDSLPDNGRLVLANDCLGNTLLARYDGEGNWEVSVYDNEDYYCRNTITKWCEIPSEKQKEPHYTKRNALFDKCVENCDPEVMKSVSDEIDKMLGKEQKPEWSEEDEKMRNLIIETLDDNSHYFPFKETKRKMIDWLKSLRPSWKPSEEQMQALKNSAYGTYQNGDGPALRELYEHLKKL